MGGYRHAAHRVLRKWGCNEDAINRVFSRAFANRGELLCRPAPTGALRILEVGHHAPHVLGLTRVSLLGGQLWDLFEEADALRNEGRRLAAGSGRALETTARLRGNGPSRPLFRLSCRSYLDEELGLVVAVSIERGRVQGFAVANREAFDAIGIILGAADVALTVVDEDLRITGFNGVSAHNARDALDAELKTGRSILEIAEAGTQDRLQSNLGRAFAGEFVASEYQTTTRDDRTLSFLFNYVPVEEVDGSVRSVIIATYNMTAASRMRDRNRELSLAVEQSPASVMITDADGTIEYANRYTEDLTGYRKEELVGRNPRMLNSGLNDPDVFEDLWNTIRAGRSWRGEMVNRRKDGSLFREIAVIAPVLDSAGRVSRYIALKEDVTSARRTERALRESEERYRMLFDSSPVGILHCRADGTVVRANQAIAAILDIPELAEATDYSVFRFDPFEESGISDAVGKALSRDQLIYREQQYAVNNERQIVLRTTVTPIHDEAGNVSGVQAVIEDFTWRHAAEQEIRRSLTEKETLLREIHHRVKNNLQNISSLLRLQIDEVPDERSRSFLRDSVGRVHTMAMVHERLYNSESLSQIAFDGVLEELVHDQVSLRVDEAGTPQLRLDLQPTSLDITTALPLGLVANELVSNALQHGLARAESTQLVVVLRTNESSILLEVRDNRPGLPPEAGTETGRGLGLQLVDALAAQLGAELERRSDGGLTVSLHLPLNAEGLSPGM